MKLLMVNITLQSLNLSHNFINEEPTKEIAVALESNTTLSKLDLSHNNIGNNTIRIFVAMLRKNTTLRSLVFNGKFDIEKHLVEDLVYYFERNRNYHKQHDAVVNLINFSRTLLKQPESEENAASIISYLNRANDIAELLLKAGYAKSNDLLNDIFSVNYLMCIRDNKLVKTNEALNKIQEKCVSELKMEIAERIMSLDLDHSECIMQDEKRQLVSILLRGIDNDRTERIKLNMLTLLQGNKGLLGEITLKIFLGVDDVLTVEQLKTTDLSNMEGCKIVIYEQMVVSPKSVTIFKVEQGELVIEKSDQPNVLFDQENILSVFNDLKMRLLEKLDNHFVASKGFCNIF